MVIKINIKCNLNGYPEHTLSTNDFVYIGLKVRSTVQQCTTVHNKNIYHTMPPFLFFSLFQPVAQTNKPGHIFRVQGSSLFCYYVTCKWEQPLTWDRCGRANQILAGKDRKLRVGLCSSRPPLQWAVCLTDGGLCSVQTQGPITQAFLIWVRVRRLWREQAALFLCWLLFGSIFTLLLQQGL